jgi:hypothetical protein
MVTMTPPRLLLHICCGPCLLGSLLHLEGEREGLEGFFCNPNIHPLAEYRRRLEALRSYAASVSFPFSVGGEYGLIPFVRMVAGREQERCRHCHGLRMRATAREARRRGIPAFSSTLLHSVHQDRDAVVEAGREAAEDVGVEFLPLDMRGTWRAGKSRWRATGLHAQRYCGCIYSEMEREGMKVLDNLREMNR